jgi:hypothetical protein
VATHSAKIWGPTARPAPYSTQVPPHRHLARRLRAAAVTLAFAVALVACGADKPSSTARETTAPSPRLYLAGDGELWIVDVAAERTRHLALRQLSPGDPPHRVIRRGRRLVLWGFTTYVADLAFRRPLRTLARGSWFFIPSAHPDRVWIAYLDPRSPATVRGLRAVREVTAAGRVTVPSVRPPGGRWPQRAFASGLLFFSGARGDKPTLWDPVTRTVVRRLPRRPLGDLGPTYGDVLASCPTWCGSLRLTNVRTGARRDIPAPRGFRFEAWLAAFSPGGRRIATPVRRRRASEDTPRRLALVDIARGSARMVPGSVVPPGYTLVAWSASGRHVFITGGERFGKRTIAAYRLGAVRARAEGRRRRLLRLGGALSHRQVESSRDRCARVRQGCRIRGRT